MPYSDKIRSYSKPGEAFVILKSKDSSPSKRGRQRLVPGAQEGRRHPTPCRRACSAFFNDDFGVYRVIYALTADSFTIDAEVRVFADDPPKLLRVQDVAKVGLSKAGPKSCSSRYRRSAWPSSAST